MTPRLMRTDTQTQRDFERYTHSLMVQRALAVGYSTEPQVPAKTLLVITTKDFGRIVPTIS